jgi:hypothetical protein
MTEALTLLAAENVTVTVSPATRLLAGRTARLKATGRLDVDGENTVYELPLESVTELVIAPLLNTTIESPAASEAVRVTTIVAVADVLCPRTYGATDFRSSRSRLIQFTLTPTRGILPIVTAPVGNVVGSAPVPWPVIVHPASVGAVVPVQSPAGTYGVGPAPVHSAPPEPVLSILNTIQYSPGSSGKLIAEVFKPVVVPVDSAPPEVGSVSRFCGYPVQPTSSYTPQRIFQAVPGAVVTWH